MPPTHPAGAERAAFVAIAVVAALIGIALVALGPDRSASSDAVVAGRIRVGHSGHHDDTVDIVVIGLVTGLVIGSFVGGVTPSTTTAPTTTVDPGTLPQTDERPTASGAQFDAGVQGLWQAIVADDPAPALPFFFPQSAYVQVKAISDPVGDYRSRLIANYEQDLHALHATTRRRRVTGEAHRPHRSGRPGGVGAARRRVQQGLVLARVRLHAALHGRRPGPLVPGVVAHLVARPVVRGAPRRDPLTSAVRFRARQRVGFVSS